MQKTDDAPNGCYYDEGDNKLVYNEGNTVAKTTGGKTDVRAVVIASEGNDSILAIMLGHIRCE